MKPATPMPFQIGDEVVIIGPDIDGSSMIMDGRFKVTQRDDKKNEYSTRGLPWYPASSLRLVSGRPMSPMNVSYDYEPGDCMHGHFEVSCPCGRKANIRLPGESEWTKAWEEPELKVGDWVCRDIGKVIFKIDDIHTGYNEKLCLDASSRIWYPAKSLRKLSIEQRIAAIERRQDKYFMNQREIRSRLGVLEGEKPPA